MNTRTRSVVVGGVLGGAVGLVFSLAQPTYCIGGGDVFACPFKSIFIWDAAPLVADAAWAAVGAMAGVVVGLVFNRVRLSGPSASV